MIDCTANNFSDTFIKSTKEFDTDYLADVFRPWDCYAQDWLDEMTVLFRFESNDLLVYTGENGLDCKIGPIDTSAFEDSIMDCMCVESPKDTCLCWRHAREYRELIGTKNVRRKLFRLLLRD